MAQIRSDISDNVLFRLFKEQFANDIRKELEGVVLNISRPMIERAVKDVVDNMQAGIFKNYNKWQDELHVVIRDERTKK